MPRNRAFQESLRSRVETSISALNRQARRTSIGRIVDELAGELEPDLASDERLFLSMLRLLERRIDALDRLDAGYSSFFVAYQSSDGDDNKRVCLLEHLERTPEIVENLAKDRRASKGWLDAEAIQERTMFRVSDTMDDIDNVFASLYDLFPKLVRSESDWDEYPLERVLLLGTAKERREPVRRVAFAFLAFVVAHSDASIYARIRESELMPLSRAAAYGEDATRWIRGHALEVLVRIFPQERLEHLRAILTEVTDANDAMVVRKLAVILFPLCTHEEVAELAPLVIRDASEYVRQGYAQYLARHSTTHSLSALHSMILEDPVERVSAFALRELLSLRPSEDNDQHELQEALRNCATSALQSVLTNPKRKLPFRLAIFEIEALLLREMAGEAPRWWTMAPLLPSLGEVVASDALPLGLVEDAAYLLELQRIASSPLLLEAYVTLRQQIATLLEGDRTTLSLSNDLSRDDLSSLLGVLSRRDMTLSLSILGGGRVRVTRGERRYFRFWRMWTEAKTPMPDKRKGYVHSHARDVKDDLLAPSPIMAEVTPTRVSGERQLYPRLAGWGSFLPRIDDALAVCGVMKRSLTIATPFGSLELRGPSGVLQRIRSFWTISWKYPYWASLRERALQATEVKEKLAYADWLKTLGIEWSRTSPPGSVLATEKHTQNFLPLALFLPPNLIDNLTAYLVSPSGSSPFDLGIFAAAILIGIVLRSAWIMQRIEATRKGIPLTIGGWGTRGKSGSERVKAALFHALRYDVVVKTTGCEAMFIHAMRDLPAQEIFIYRPYDKATIWEQRDVVGVARNLNAQVFLWECMALQPKFVDTLQNEWMQDNVTTLTNAYPDHEDIQGPGGEDVARVIGRFMPVGGTTFTTEEQMLPLLRDSAKRKGAKLFEVHPLEADLLPQDMLDRLPYQEHPRNMAMVIALAAYLGIDRDLALAEIADYVVLDLGVLKTYPEVEYLGRRLVFSNGMSANERAGFMSNWTRLGFDQNDVDNEPHISLASVVNNRGDRVARSRVFAQIFVDDAPVDQIILINSNLGGMMQFITEALDKKIAGMQITGDGGTSRALERYDAQMKWVKVPTQAKTVEIRLQKMLETVALPDPVKNLFADAAFQKELSEFSEALLERAKSALSGGELPPSREPRDFAERWTDVEAHAKRLLSRTKRSKDTRKQIAEVLERGDSAGADALFRALYRELFLDRICILWEYGATGDQVIHFLAKSVAPGQLVRVMGAQNIKGTGLDFVYRWLSMDRVRNNLTKLQKDPKSRAEILGWLGTYNDFSLIDIRESVAALEGAKASGDASWAAHEALLSATLERLRNVEKEKALKLFSTSKAGFGSKVAKKFEAVFDYLDSMRRTRLARKVMAQLFAKRVSHTQAAIVLRDVTARGKGGWLLKDIKVFKTWWDTVPKKLRKVFL